MLVVDTLDDLSGVRSTQTTIKQGRSAVELDATQTGPEDVIAAIAGLNLPFYPDQITLTGLYLSEPMLTHRPVRRPATRP